MSFFKKLFGSKTKTEPIPKPVEPTEPAAPSVKPYDSEQQYTYLTNLIRAHKSVNPFNYNLVVVWALSLMKEGNEMPGVLMLASFAEPIDTLEIQPYVSRALIELNLTELDGEAAILALIRYHVMNIVTDNSLRKNLRELYHLCNQYDYGYGLNPFYLLHYAWEDLEYEDENYYYAGATLDNIESFVKKEAEQWLKNH
ncbi:hypothetical protein ACLI08_03710 [Flavobacterium sp. RNTU_13]|uniref:hypothetical protein n=1 Tax=Flavobacterium sp. RNTU_13 TaxID=3375145 RepID=UPI00398668D5